MDVIIPHDQLSPEALKGLIEEFVSRDGTDNGYVHQSLAERADQVRQQLTGGQVCIVFDDQAQTVNIVACDQLAGLD